MKRQDMNRKVANELKHIPRIKGNLEQNLFRLGYNAMRRHDLAENPATDPSVSFRRVLEQVRKTNPGFLPVYGRDLFPDV
jgi:hypothetical protein